jgi:hypothetical protein
LPEPVCFDGKILKITIQIIIDDLFFIDLLVYFI